MIGLGVLLAAVAFAVWPRGKSLPQVASILRTQSPAPAAVRPGRGLIDHMEEVGRDGAAKVMEETLGTHKANELVKGFVTAFAAANPAPKV